MRVVVNSYQFSRFTLDVVRNKLCDNETGDYLELTNRQFTLLRILCDNSPQPVSKTSLVESLWPNTQVSDWSLSRLISDTRKLLSDDGDSQHIIKTERGVGFVLKDVVQHTGGQDSAKRIDKKNRAFMLAMLFVGVLAIIAGFIYLKNASQYKEKREVLTALQTMSQLQDNTYTSFVAQANRRNELVEMVQQRLGIEKKEQFEKFFSKHYNSFTQQEKFVCDQMRAITSTGLMKNNQAIVDILDTTPAIFEQIEQAKALQQHLRFWLNKYHAVFTQREDMCLLYVGVEDDVPYPSGVDQRVKEWLAQNEM
jgi:DNA-binding winged helix-turn-helix (wHTH) protein